MREEREGGEEEERRMVNKEVSTKKRVGGGGGAGRVPFKSPIMASLEILRLSAASKICWKTKSARHESSYYA